MEKMPTNKIENREENIVKTDKEVKERQEKYIIDCDASPSVPKGYTIEEHQKGGQFEWDASKVQLYFSEAQERSVVEGSELRKELADKPVMNACVLDFLLAHKDLIPEGWKGKEVYFWGTVYLSSEEGWSQCVRCLTFEGNECHEGVKWISHQWFGDSPAALREVA